MSVDFNLYLITDRRSLPEGEHLLQRVEAALLGGVRCVQLREKDLSPDDLLPLAHEMRMLTAAFGAKLLINGNIEVARAVDADGIHLGGDAPTTAEARRLIGPGKLIGVSTHRRNEIEAAARDGGDFVTFGPVWPTPSKAPYGPPVGLDLLREACLTPPLPVFALGGVTVSRLSDLSAAGCRRVACIGGILFSDDPTGAARQFTARLREPPDYQERRCP